MANNLGPVRFSHLKAYGRSAMHGYHARMVDTAPTQAMQLGTAVHALVFGTKQVLGYAGVRRGKDFDAFNAAHPEALILTMSDYERATAMATAVRESPTAAQYLKGLYESTILFRWMGLDCRATPDVRGDGFLTELKTSSTSEPMRFTWHALRMAYHAQMRMQQLAISSPSSACYIVCVEDKAPYPVTVFEIDPKALEMGERLLILWAERLKTCEASGEYPPYAQGVYPLIAPQDDLALEFEEAV